jgi:phosphoesterase RecJ-like protein
MVGEVLRSARLLQDACGNLGLVYTVITLDSSSEVGWEDTETVIDIIRTANEADIAVVFKEVAPDDWNVSLRSKGSADVSGVARAFGGGGHRCKAGYTDAGSQVVIVDRLIRRLCNVTEPS